MVEQAQRREARFIFDNQSHLASVKKMLTDLNWATLIHSRKEQKAVMLYKIVHHQVDILVSNYLTPLLPHLISPEAIIKDFRSHHPQSMYTYIHSFPLQ